MSNNEIEMEIKNQVLSDYFILKREATGLYANRLFFEGLDKLKTIISGIPLSQENYERADEIITQIDKIESDSNTLNGPDTEMTQYKRSMYRNLKSREIFNSTLRTITKILQDQGYFEFIPKGKSDFWNPSKGRKSFKAT